MSKAGQKLIKAAEEAVAIARGEQRMMCRACGSIVRAPEFRCDCTKMGLDKQRIVPVPDKVTFVMENCTISNTYQITITGGKLVEDEEIEALARAGYEIVNIRAIDKKYQE